MKKKYYFLLFNLFFIYSFICAQTATLNWQVTIGGSEIDYGYDIFQIDSFLASSAPSYRVAVAGRTASQDGTIVNCAAVDTDAFYIQLDTLGAIVNCTTIGGSCFDEFHKGKYVLTSNGQVNAVLLGRTCSNDRDVNGNHGSFDAWMVRADFSGNLLSKKCIGGIGWDDIFDFIEMPDKGFIMCGVSSSDTIEGSPTGGHGGFDGWLARTDSMGNIIWNKHYGGSNSDFLYSIIKTQDGNFVLAGFTNSTDGNITGNHGNNDYWIMKVDTNGAIIWSNVLGGSNDDYGYKIIETEYDFGFLIAGYTYSFDGTVSGNHSTPGSSDAWVVKLDFAGNLLWNKCFGGFGADFCFSISKGDWGNAILLIFPNGWNGNPAGCPGTNAYKAWLAKIDSTGNIIWNSCFGSNNFDGLPESIIQSDSYNYYFLSHPHIATGDVTAAYGGSRDIWLAKIHDNSESNFIKNTSQKFTPELFPNPVEDRLTIQMEDLTYGKLRIKNCIGEILISQSVHAFTNQIDVSKLKSGLYLLEITLENKTINYKFLKTN